MGNNKYNFAVELPSKLQDTTGFYKKGLVDILLKKYPWLTVAGLDSPYTTPSGKAIRGIDHAGAGNVITFGTAKNHDVNWVERSGYVREKGYTPIYNLAKDWNTVVNRLDMFANSRKPIYRPTYACNCVSSGNVFYINGVRVEKFDNFYKVGYTIIPRFPKTTEYYVFEKPEVQNIIITIKGLY